MAEQTTIAPQAIQPPGLPETTDSSAPQPARNFRRRVISRLPFTKEFTESLLENQKERLKERQDKYAKLESVDDKLREKFNFEFNFAERRLSETEAWIDMAVSYYTCAVIAIAIPVYLAAPPLVARLFQATILWHNGFWWAALELILLVLTGILACVIIILPVIVLGAKVHDFFNVNGIVLFWALVLLIVSSTYLYGLYAQRIHTPLPRYELTVCFIIQLGFAAPLFLAIASSYRSFAKTLERRRQKFHSRAVIIDETLSILSEIEQANFETQWTEFSHRAWLTKRLDVVASCIENHFSRYFLTSAPEMDRWIDRNTTEMANGVRELIKWVVAPRDHTREDFKARIVKYFTSALASEWGKFDLVPPEKLSRKQGVKDRVSSAVTALLTAAVPVLLLLLLRRLNVIAAEPLVTYLTIGAYVWAALSLLSRLDPQYAAKLGALKDLTSTLPFGKKGGDNN